MHLASQLERTRLRILAIASSSGIRSDAAEDVYQEVAVACCKCPGTDWTAPQTGLIVKITKARCIDRRRKESHQPVFGPMDGRAVEPPAGDDYDPQLQCELMETMASLQAAIRSLPTNYASVLQQHYWEHKPLEHIALAKGRPLGTIQTWKKRGIRLLRRKLNRRERG